MAKCRAARAALRDLFQLDVKDSVAFVSGGQLLLNSESISTMEVTPLADLVSELVKAKYKEICDANGIPPGKEIAGFVMTRTKEEGKLEATVISIGGGKKNINMSL